MSVSTTPASILRAMGLMRAGSYEISDDVRHAAWRRQDGTFWVQCVGMRDAATAVSHMPPTCLWCVSR